jgi:hypothetical protein
MYERLGEAVLKSGQRMEIGVVLAPDPEWKDRIIPFLGHKGEPYASHIRRSYEGPMDELETRYYVGHLDGRVITEVMIVGARGAGILGHVYTLPEERRKGAYQAVMAAQMADMPRRGFQVLSLGTGFDSAPYWIYHGFGFAGIGPGRGEMLWESDPQAAARLFRLGATKARDARWDDWGFFAWLGLLPVTPEEELPRSRVMRLKTRGIMEGPFVRLLFVREQESQMSVRVLQSEHGATVAWAILAPDTGWRAPDPHCLADAWTLDLHAHPGFASDLPKVLTHLPWPDAPVAVIYAEPAGPKAAALKSAGFSRVASLPAWMRSEDGPGRDSELWVRQP